MYEGIGHVADDWIDPDTGEPAEETYIHLEDH